ncbi:beta-propeller fold lactonase family protein [Pelagicoccus sp. SDUM812002]|uniref:beta-propeller fold lactonase family protein n=1 Tax=Pelagicoccus sp. SDUM812002 TaxID=3041266 RepID=UPI00280F6070|nr:beta-propeller fold lactonase family protein [Pelagicoccus sp. SDUM812002]MDQ8185178.1 beta-propeller fold lactonase family protein [Pelagicoccus sp. SDUM812002]
MPSSPLWFRSTIALAWVLIASTPVDGQDSDDEDDEPLIEVIKQLVFIEQHLYSAGVLDGIESPYDVRVASDGGHVYVASLKNDAISYFSRNQTNGELTYSNFVTQADFGENALDGVRSLAMSPDGEFVYAVSMFSNSLATFDRDKASGSLSFVDAIYDADNGVDGLDGPRSIVMSPDGKNLYVAAYDDSKLSVYSRNTVNGVASFLGVYEEGDQGVQELSSPHALAMSPDGKSLYVALWSNEIIVFARESASGLLTYQSRLTYLEGESKKQSPRALALSPDGKFLYVASANNDALSILSRDTETGAIANVANVLDDTGGVVNLDGPHAISISSDGAYVYIAAVSSDSVTSFERNATTGGLTYYQSIVSEAEDSWDMNGPISIGTSPDGEHVYLGSGSGTHSILTFRREVLVDPPEFVVQPVDQTIEEGQTVAFYALAQGVDLSYQWLRNGSPVSGKTMPVLTIPAASLSDDGSKFSIRVSNPGGILTSPEVSLTVLPPVVVNAPSDLTALDISSKSARLVWKDESDNETSFDVQRREPGGEFTGLVTVLEDQIQYDDTSLSASTTYIYRVRARKGENISLWSNDAVIESFADSPNSPVNLNVVEQTYNKVSLRWSDRSAVEDGFRILRRLDQAGDLWTSVATVEKNVTTFVDRSVNPLSTYAYRVQAYNESGDSDYTNSVVAITGEIPVEAITPVSRNITADANTSLSIGVMSSKDWEAISQTPWLVVTSPAKGEGSGNQGVNYRSLMNKSQNERIGTIIVGGLEHTVIQEGSPPFFAISSTETQVGADGGIKVVGIESNMDWTASVESDWVSITSGATGSDNDSVVLAIDENDSFEARETELIINDSTHLIKQAGKVPTLNLSSLKKRFAREGGAGVVSVDANIDWDASVSASWITLTNSIAGTGDGSIGFSVVPNDTSDMRTADILVNDKALSITQDPPLESDVIEPEWVRVTEKPLGVDLQWLDLSDDESGFRLRRSVLGSDRVFAVADLPAGTTTYFDRDAPRGKQVEYALVSYDAIGESDEVKTTSDLIPSANMTSVALYLEAAADTKVFEAKIPLAGDGEVVLQREASGGRFGVMNFGSRYPVSRYRLDSDAGELELLGEAQSTDWNSYYKFNEAAGGVGLNFNSDHIAYAAQSMDGGSAYPRGARAMGQLLSPESVIVIGFEIEGEIELPILLQGVGSSINAGYDSERAANLKVELFELSGTGALALLASNEDWMTAQNETTISLDNAMGKTGALVLSSTGGIEVRLLRMLGSGRYVAVLRSASGDLGTAALEVYDAR